MTIARAVRRPCPHRSGRHGQGRRGDKRLFRRTCRSLLAALEASSPKASTVSDGSRIICRCTPTASTRLREHMPRCGEGLEAGVDDQLTVGNEHRSAGTTSTSPGRHRALGRRDRPALLSPTGIRLGSPRPRLRSWYAMWRSSGRHDRPPGGTSPGTEERRRPCLRDGDGRPSAPLGATTAWPPRACRSASGRRSPATASTTRRHAAGAPRRGRRHPEPRQGRELRLRLRPHGPAEPGAKTRPLRLEGMDEAMVAPRAPAGAGTRSPATRPVARLLNETGSEPYVCPTGTAARSGSAATGAVRGKTAMTKAPLIVHAGASLDPEDPAERKFLVSG